MSPVTTCSAFSVENTKYSEITNTKIRDTIPPIRASGNKIPPTTDELVTERRHGRYLALGHRPQIALVSQGVSCRCSCRTSITQHAMIVDPLITPVLYPVLSIICGALRVYLAAGLSMEYYIGEYYVGGR